MNGERPIAARIYTDAGVFLVRGEHATLANKVNSPGGFVRLVRMVGTGFASDWPRPGGAIHIRKDKIVAVEEW